MALEATFMDLLAQIKDLEETLTGLRLTVVEDSPRPCDAILVDRFGDEIEEMLGRQKEAQEAAADGCHAVEPPANIEAARRALGRVQDSHRRMMYTYFDLVSYERLAQLTQLGRERGREWQAWVGSVRQALDDCRRPVYEADQALCGCWQEIAERAGMNSVTVQATGIRNLAAESGTPRSDARQDAGTVMGHA